MKALLFSAVVSAALLVAPGQAVADTKPNIVFIFLDNFGWDEPGFNGGGIIRGSSTPAMDALADEGMRFQRQR